MQPHGKGYPGAQGRSRGQTEELDIPIPKTNVGPERDFPGGLGPRGIMGEGQGKIPGGGRRERIQGMSGAGARPLNSPKGCLDYSLRESIAILAGSENAGMTCFIALGYN